MNRLRERDHQCTNLSKIKRFKPRDLYASHAKRTGKSRAEIVNDALKNKKNLYHPHPFDTEPIATPRAVWERKIEKLTPHQQQMKEYESELKKIRRLSREIFKSQIYPKIVTFEKHQKMVDIDSSTTSKVEDFLRLHRKYGLMKYPTAKP